MPLDAPDLPEKFARLQQQLVLTEVELMKLEDLRDELRTRETAVHALLRDLQAIADRACAERDHAGRQAAELTAALDATRAELARETAHAADLNSQVLQLAAGLEQHRARATELAAALARIEASLSWRWTAPFRAIGRRLGRRA